MSQVQHRPSARPALLGRLARQSIDVLGRVPHSDAVAATMGTAVAAAMAAVLMVHSAMHGAHFGQAAVPAAATLAASAAAATSAETLPSKRCHDFGFEPVQCTRHMARRQQLYVSVASAAVQIVLRHFGLRDLVQ